MALVQLRQVSTASHGSLLDASRAIPRLPCLGLLSPMGQRSTATVLVDGAPRCHHRSAPPADALLAAPAASVPVFILTSTGLACFRKYWQGVFYGLFVAGPMPSPPQAGVPFQACFQEHPASQAASQMYQQLQLTASCHATVQMPYAVFVGRRWQGGLAASGPGKTHLLRTGTLWAKDCQTGWAS